MNAKWNWNRGNIGVFSDETIAKVHFDQSVKCMSAKIQVIVSPTNLTFANNFHVRNWASVQLAIKEMSRCSARGKFQGMYTTFVSTMQMRQHFKPREDITKNPKQVYVSTKIILKERIY